MQMCPCDTEKFKEEYLALCKYESIRKIRGFHGGDYEECRLLGCGTV
jgi:hypothetical protein